MTNPGRIAIIDAGAHLDTIPSLCNAIHLLASAGYHVDVFTRSSSEYVRPVFNDPSITVFALKYRRERWRPIRGIMRLMPSRWDWVMLRRLQASFRHWRSGYRCLIGVDDQGLMEAGDWSKRFRTPLVYYSLELILSREASTKAVSDIKKAETELSRRCEFVIIQDEERAKLLSTDNGISMNKFVLVPNAPLGPARRKPSDYWHAALGVPRGRRIVLHSGSIGTWTGVAQIVESVSSWPEDWVLVVHTRSNSENAADLEDLRRRGAPGRVFFSCKAASRHEYDTLVDGADIGVAFYLNVPGSTFTQENIRSIGLSSGKIAYCLRAGLPVIVNTFPSVHRLVQELRCGLAVENADGIRTAISQIAQQYADFSKNAIRTFDRMLDPRQAFQEAIRRIDSFGKGVP